MRVDQADFIGNIISPCLIQTTETLASSEQTQPAGHIPVTGLTRLRVVKAESAVSGLIVTISLSVSHLSHGDAMPAGRVLRLGTTLYYTDY